MESLSHSEERGLLVAPIVQMLQISRCCLKGINVTIHRTHTLNSEQKKHKGDLPYRKYALNKTLTVKQFG